MRASIVGLVAAILVWAPVTVAFTASAFAQTTKETIVFMRHGEKPAADLGQLDCQGLNRALALPWVLISRYGHANDIFAPDPSQQMEDHGKRYDYVRPLATIEPTAIALGLPVDTRFGFQQIDLLERELLLPRYGSALVFVAWEHRMLVKLARNIMACGRGPGIDSRPERRGLRQPLHPQPDAHRYSYCAQLRA